MIHIKNLEEKYIEDVSKLAIQEYQQELKKCKSLVKTNFEDEITEIIKSLFENKHGKVALENDKVMGYIAFWGPWDGALGKVKGVYSPIGGSAFAGSDRGKLASILFAEVAEEMADNGICGFALSRYAHDEEIAKSLIMNGFGIRCADAIMKLSDRHIVDKIDTELEFTELIGEEKKMIESLRKGLVRHLCKAPIFFPTDLKEFSNWMKQDSIRIVAARKDQEIIGYMALDDEAETFVSEHPSVYNICGAYVDENYRNSGVAQQLLEHLCQICEKEGKEYLGVECETLNPTALRFWRKYFEIYTYSYARRIDERVVGYEKYLDMCWGVLE